MRRQERKDGPYRIEESGLLAGIKGYWTLYGPNGERMSSSPSKQIIQVEAARLNDAYCRGYEDGKRFRKGGVDGDTRKPAL